MFQFHPVSHSPSSPFSTQAKKLTAILQFDVTTPHVVYACLGGFVVLVRSPISFRDHTISSSASVWHVLPLHPREGERHSFFRITIRAQEPRSSILENLSGRSSSELSSVSPKYLLSFAFHSSLSLFQVPMEPEYSIQELGETTTPKLTSPSN